ncbi:MAG: DUF1844 domain-containing protein [Planctomycetota bacterium]|jgi:hypothetical protein
MAEIITPGGTGESGDEAPKIVVDSDWKAEAQAEKEKLKQQESEQEASGAPKPGELPEANFMSIVRMMATQALMYLGAFPDPQTGQAILAPEYAQYHIDLLGVLEEKTQGNLSDDESKEVAELLRELRQRFVEIMGSVSEAMAKEQAEKGQTPASEPTS